MADFQTRGWDEPQVETRGWDSLPGLDQEQSDALIRADHEGKPFEVTVDNGRMSDNRVTGEPLEPPTKPWDVSQNSVMSNPALAAAERAYAFGKDQAIEVGQEAAKPAAPPSIKSTDEVIAELAKMPLAERATRIVMGLPVGTIETAVQMAAQIPAMAAQAVGFAKAVSEGKFSPEDFQKATEEVTPKWVTDLASAEAVQPETYAGALMSAGLGEAFHQGGRALAAPGAGVVASTEAALAGEGTSGAQQRFREVYAKVAPVTEQLLNAGILGQMTVSGARSALRRPEDPAEAAKPVLQAENLDDAISAAERAINAPEAPAEIVRGEPAAEAPPELPLSQALPEEAPPPAPGELPGLRIAAAADEAIARRAQNERAAELARPIEPDESLTAPAVPEDRPLRSQAEIVQERLDAQDRARNAQEVRQQIESGQGRVQVPGGPEKASAPRTVQEMTVPELDAILRLTRSEGRRAEIAAELVRRHGEQSEQRGLIVPESTKEPTDAVQERGAEALPVRNEPQGGEGVRVENAQGEEAPGARIAGDHRPAPEAQGVAAEATNVAEKATPEFIDYVAKKDAPSFGKTPAVKKGDVRTFKTDKQAAAFAKGQRLRGFTPRQTEAGWVLSRPYRERTAAPRVEETVARPEPLVAERPPESPPVEAPREAPKQPAVAVREPVESEPVSAEPKGRTPMFARPLTGPEKYRNVDALAHEMKPKVGTDKRGVTYYEGNGVGLARGRDPVRVGQGTTRLKYDVFDTTKRDANGKPLKVGAAVVDVDRHGLFKTIRNIEIDKAYRQKGNGYGERAVATMIAHNKGVHIEVHDIQHAGREGEYDALPFWQKMGVQLDNYSSNPDVEMNGRISRDRYLQALSQRGKVWRDGTLTGNDQAEAGARGNEPRAPQPDTGGTGSGGRVLPRAPGPLQERPQEVAKPQEPPPESGGSASGPKLRQGRAPGLSETEARSALKGAIEKTRVPIRVVQSVEDLRKIEGFEQAPDDAKGGYYKGRIYVVADNIADALDAERTVARHEVTHAGIDVVYGDSHAREVALTKIVAANPKVRETARAWREQYGDEFLADAKKRGLSDADAKRELRLTSFEEGLAHFSEAGNEIKGWKQFAAVIQKGLRSLGLNKLADHLESLTDAEALRFLDEMRRATQEHDEGILGRIVPAFHRAFHGSPHDFEKFDASKIGSGEGNQAFGHGLYFAGRRDVADYYRKTLATSSDHMRVFIKGGKELEGNTPERHAASLLYFNDLREMRALAKRWLKEAEEGTNAGTNDVAEKAGMSPVEYWGRLNDFIKTHTRRDIDVRKGRLYEVELAPKEHEYLDWEGGIGKQSDAVRSVARDFLREEGYLREGENGPRQLDSAWKAWKMERGGMAEKDGEALYSALTRKLGGQRQASEFLASRDVPGIRYLDNASRDKGSGYHNYVIFDEKHVNIVGKYARPLDKRTDEELAKSPVAKVAEQGKKLIGKVRNLHGMMDELSPLGSLAKKDEYLVKRYRTLGRLAKIEEATHALYGAFRNAGNDAPRVYKFLTTKDADPTSIRDPKLRDQAVRAKDMLIKVGEQLVARGLLAREVFEANRGEYLPRIYLRHLLDDEAINVLSSGKKPSTMGYLKARKDIPEDVRRLILGEITDPAYLVSKAYGTQARDIALLDWLREISTEKAWVLPDSLVKWEGRDVTPFWLKASAKRIRAQLVHYAESDQGPARAIADKMDAVADKALTEHEGVPDGWKQIPDAPRYGQLRGMIVAKEIYNDIVGQARVNPNDASIAERILGNGGTATKFTQMWKWAKVAANPPAQIRNFLSNGIMLNLSGVPMRMIVPRVVQAIKEIRTNGKYWQIAKKYGVTESTFSAQELFRIEREFLDLQARHADLVSLATVKNLSGKFMDLTGDIYQKSEAIFKTAKIIDDMKHGMSEEQAILNAQKWLFDYSLVTPSMRYLRNAPVGTPFITFYFKALPRMLEVATHHPLRFAPYLAIPYVLNALIAQMQDVSQDDVKKLREALPNWLREKNNALILPMKDEKGRWVAMDYGYFLPWSMWQDLTTDLAQGKFGQSMQDAGIFGGPLPDLIAAVKTNKDPFSGKEIINEFDPPAKQVASVMGYLWDMAAPTWMTSYGFAEHLRKSLTNTVDKYGKPTETPGQATMRFFGVNLYPINPEQTRAQNIRRMQFEIAQEKRRRSVALRDRTLSAEERRDIVQQYGKLLMERQKQLREYARASEVNPKLRTGP